MRLTNQDKRAAIKKVLAQIKAKTLPKMNGKEIADMVGATKQLVSNIRGELNGRRKAPKSETGEPPEPEGFSLLQKQRFLPFCRPGY